MAVSTDHLYERIFDLANQISEIKGGGDTSRVLTMSMFLNSEQLAEALIEEIRNIEIELDILIITKVK